MSDASGSPLPEDWQICAVCGYPLERWSNRVSGKELAWQHIRPDSQDHVAVPVDLKDLVFNQHCDFCDADATHIVLCDDFQMPDTHHTSRGPWAACGPCADLVSRNRWNDLINRVRAVGGPIARRTPRRVLVRMYQAVQLHSHGVITQEEWRERNGFKPTKD